MSTTNIGFTKAEREQLRQQYLRQTRRRERLEKISGVALTAALPLLWVATRVLGVLCYMLALMPLALCVTVLVGSGLQLQQHGLSFFMVAVFALGLASTYHVGVATVKAIAKAILGHVLAAASGRKA